MFPNEKVDGSGVGARGKKFDEMKRAPRGVGAPLVFLERVEKEKTKFGTQKWKIGTPRNVLTEQRSHRTPGVALRYTND
jgi:hypothetical protein